MGKSQTPILPPWVYGSEIERESWIPDDSIIDGGPRLKKWTHLYSYTCLYAPEPNSHPESAYVHGQTIRVDREGHMELLIDRTIGEFQRTAVCEIETYHYDPPDRYNWTQKGWHWVTYLVGEPNPIRKRYPPVGEAYTERYLPDW